MTVPQCEPLCAFSDRWVRSALRFCRHVVVDVWTLLEIEFPHRLYFTTFPHPAPPPRRLNPPAEPIPNPLVRPRSHHSGTTPAQDENATYYFSTIEQDLNYYSFFKDWGPLNLAMVYKACIYIHELLEVSSGSVCVRSNVIKVGRVQGWEFEILSSCSIFFRWPTKKGKRCITCISIRCKCTNY